MRRPEGVSQGRQQDEVELEEIVEIGIAYIRHHDDFAALAQHFPGIELEPVPGNDCFEALGCCRFRGHRPKLFQSLQTVPG